jgi:hypothetical protein
MSRMALQLRGLVLSFLLFIGFGVLLSCGGAPTFELDGLRPGMNINSLDAAQFTCAPVKQSKDIECERKNPRRFFGVQRSECLSGSMPMCVVLSISDSSDLM